jgi:hypothetical protein
MYVCTYAAHGMVNCGYIVCHLFVHNTHQRATLSRGHSCDERTREQTNDNKDNKLFVLKAHLDDVNTFIVGLVGVVLTSTIMNRMPVANCVMSWCVRMQPTRFRISPSIHSNRNHGERLLALLRFRFFKNCGTCANTQKTRLDMPTHTPITCRGSYTHSEKTCAMK